MNKIDIHVQITCSINVIYSRIIAKIQLNGYPFIESTSGQTGDVYTIRSATLSNYSK